MVILRDKFDSILTVLWISLHVMVMAWEHFQGWASVCCPPTLVREWLLGNWAWVALLPECKMPQSVWLRQKQPLSTQANGQGHFPREASVQLCPVPWAGLERVPVLPVASVREPLLHTTGRLWTGPKKAPLQEWMLDNPTFSSRGLLKGRFPIRTFLRI